MSTIPSTDEQKFLATLQECLQADNDKRTAAEVNLKQKLLNKILFFSIRLSIKIYRMNKKHFY
jgi:hypothetical protein